MDLVIASHNRGKVREIAELLQPFELRVLSAADLRLVEPEETGTTFRANAALKAKAAASAANLPALADDSGLEVDALDGAPGIYSARWAGPGKDFDLAMAKVHDELAARDCTTPAQRRANFICLLCLAWPDDDLQFFEGRVHGRIVQPARGGNGFGYDPIFCPDGHQLTFGEMDPTAKHSLSHRAIAFKKFVNASFPRTNT